MIIMLQVLLLLLFTSSAALANDAVWDALAEGGHVVLMRHALAPGTGDPANFQLGDCSTQRNLNDTGREQARRTGAAFRERDIPVGKIYTSQWCRCRETAELLALGSVEDLPPLNSFFQSHQQREPQTKALQAFLAQLSVQTGNVVMVTHAVNISAIAARGVASGEIVVVRPNADGTITPVGTIAPL